MPELPLVGDEFAGYRMRAVLGRGGMSVVYQAENLRLNNVIALKVLAPELAADDVFRARFLEESRIAASLNHPNVIPIYDTGAQDDLLYIAMRYVSGTDLRQMIKKRGRILPATALFLVSQAARALDAAHRMGLVHRDVKPGNLLIERGADEADPDHVYLADFGITKHAMSRTGLTSTGQFLGTVDYVAPEQIRGTSVLGLADQYSLGCVLYECLTGRVPFEKDLDAAIIWAHVEETPTMPTVLRPELPPEIDEVFGRVLAKRPEERYGSCREFVEAARMALGLPGRGTQPSLPHGVMTGEPPTAARPASQAGAPAERFSWSSAAGAAHAPGSVAPVAPGSVTAAPPPGRPSGPRWYRRPAWLAVLAALVLAAAGLGTWAGLSAASPPARTMPARTPSHPGPAHTASALMSALALTNRSADARGLLPPSACRQDSAAKVTCTAPAAAITAAVFQTYPSLTALYAAYTAKVTSLNSGRFRQDFSDCGAQETYGEAGWNHNFRHTRKTTVAQMTAGTVSDDQAAGRVFCTYAGGLEYMAWTQNDGRLLGYVAGPVHAGVWTWWVAVHHNIGIGGAPMNMGTSPPPATPGTSPPTASMSPSPAPSMSSMPG
jgi:Protein kinase domain